MQIYLNTVYFQSRTEASVGARTVREMRTLALIGDLLLRGQLASALDVLVQRTKALELSVEHQGWAQARWLELAPSVVAACWSGEERRGAMREQELEARLGLWGPSR